MQSCKWGRKSKSNIILLSICNSNTVPHCQHNSAWIHLGSGKEGRAYRGDGHSLSPPTWARSSPQICPVIREVLFIDESTAIDRMVSTQVCLLVWWVHCTCSTKSVHCWNSAVFHGIAMQLCFGEASVCGSPQETTASLLPFMPSSYVGGNNVEQCACSNGVIALMVPWSAPGAMPIAVRFPSISYFVSPFSGTHHTQAHLPVGQLDSPFFLRKHFLCCLPHFFHS